AAHSLARVDGARGKPFRGQIADHRQPSRQQASKKSRYASQPGRENQPPHLGRQSDFPTPMGCLALYHAAQ
ncbi:MAG TPA: hypothetical protein VHM88_22210, partial [Candidatus Acidoferrales bacterium]|nr:hypothetical protein [Candidatus Acidoferrales bacterium]